MGLKKSEYLLGYTDREQLRLIRQGRALAPTTWHFLRFAGIASGMRVLDIGCGMGDVTMIVAQLVGPAGRVVSIDLHQATIEIAQRRALTFGLDNTTFYRADISTFTDTEPFDAIVGRLILEFLPDTAAIIGRLCRLLRPGGNHSAPGADMENLAGLHIALAVADCCHHLDPRHFSSRWREHRNGATPLPGIDRSQLDAASAARRPADR